MYETIGYRGTMGQRESYILILVIMAFMTSFRKLVKSFQNHVKACKRGFPSYCGCHKFLCIPYMGNTKVFVLIGQEY